MEYDRGKFLLKYFHSVLNKVKFNLVQNRKENSHYDQIPFNLKGNGNRFLPSHSRI